MPTRREAALGLMAGAAAGMMMAAGKAVAQPVAEADASAIVLVWLNALRSGDPAVVTKVLATEFQIMRSDGTGFDKDGYLKNLPVQTSDPTLKSITATGDGDKIVVRYVVNIEQTINNQAVQAEAPRLSTFRKDGDAWVICSHANFARLG